MKNIELKIFFRNIMIALYNIVNLIGDVISWVSINFF